VAGIVLACPFLLISFHRSRRKWTVEEMEQRCGLPVLAIVPAHDEKDDRWKEEADSAMRFLEEALRLMPGAKQVRTVVVTSATPAEGKSTTLKSLALSLAGRAKRVLVVDADLHRPTVHRQFSLRRRAGLSTVLTGNCSLEDALQSFPGAETLKVLTAGPVPPSGSELLASVAFAELIAKVAPCYDYVLIDSPPVLALSDAVGLAGLCDAVLVVARFGKVTAKETALGVERLSRSSARAAGLVVNSVPVR
jgi:capsular exopolysaccharide synthesis family protein